MKRFNKTNLLLKMLKPMATLILLFTLILNVNAQNLTANSIKAPAVVKSIGTFEPGVIIGSNVILTDAPSNKCNEFTYEWQSASDEFFTENLTKNLANTKDYNPGKVSTTTYFRRIVKYECLETGSRNESKTGSVKITIN